MIYTITLNPALDYIMEVPDYREGQTNRSREEKIFLGGKGINVSIVLDNLGIKSTALGFCAGFTGNMVVRMLKEKGIDSDFILLEQGMTRINVKLKAEKETEINGEGPPILQTDLQRLYQKLDMVQEGDILVLAGSVPGTLSKTLYSDIMRRLSHKAIKFIIDTEGEMLKNTLSYRPFFIKPNHRELEAVFGRRIEEKEEVVRYAKKLQKMGAQNVMVSLGDQGAVLAAENGKIYQKEAPAGRLVNSTGAGDSMVAGFLAEYLQTQDYEQAFLKGLAAGSASAFSQDLATQKEIYALFEKL